MNKDVNGNLHNADARADIDEQVRENAWIDAREAVLGNRVTLEGKHLVLNVF